MKKWMGMAGALVVCGALAGCGGADHGDALVEEQIAIINDLADLWSDPKANGDKIKVDYEKLANVQKEFAKLPKDRQEAALKKHSDELTKANTKAFQKASSGGLADMLKVMGADLSKAGADPNKKQPNK